MVGIRDPEKQQLVDRQTDRQQKHLSSPGAS